VNASFYGSIITCNSGVCTWAVSNLDVSIMNKGSASVTAGNNPKTIYGLDSNWISWSNIPLVDTVTYLKCWGIFNADRTSAPLNAPVTVTSISGVQQVNKEVSVKSADKLCITGAQCAGSTIWYTPIGILFVLVSINLIL
jgi:hypothetical protein